VKRIGDWFDTMVGSVLITGLIIAVMTLGLVGLLVVNDYINRPPKMERVEE
jgi:hypothetical protein